MAINGQTRGRKTREPEIRIPPAIDAPAKGTRTTKKVEGGSIRGFTIPPLETGIGEIGIVGITSLIMHCFSEKARQQLRNRGQQRPSMRAAKNPQEEYRQSIHYYQNASDRYALPTDAVKKAIEKAAGLVGLDGWRIRPGLFISGLEDPNWIEVLSKGGPQMREDAVRLQGPGRPVDLRYRAEFLDWEARFRVEYVRHVVSPEQITHLVQYAGFCIGLLEWRQDKPGGSHGRFQVTDAVFADMDVKEKK
jgi:hypothetical protein